MAKLIGVKFKFPIYEKGRAYKAGQVVKLSESDLKRFDKKDYVIVRKAEIKKTKDIKKEDKETVDIET